MSDTYNYNCFPLNPYLSINTPKKTALQFVYSKISSSFQLCIHLEIETINDKSFWICTLYFLACIFLFFSIFLGKSRISHKFCIFLCISLIDYLFKERSFSYVFCLFDKVEVLLLQVKLSYSNLNVFGYNVGCHHTT